MTQLVFKISCFGVCDGKLYWLPLNVGLDLFLHLLIYGEMMGNIMRVDSLDLLNIRKPISRELTYTNRCGQYTLEVIDYYGNSLPPYLFTIQNQMS